MVIGIDATNIRQGGGLTYLVELLSVADPEKHNFDYVVVWGGKPTLEKLPNRLWLKKINPPALNKNLFIRILWQKFILTKAVRSARCKVLFVPGGSHASDFKPIVTMSQNLLPFEWKELLRFGTSLLTLKLVMLRYTQTFSFRAADGLIFLTRYAKNTILKKNVCLSTQRTRIIPHGINPQFLLEPRSQQNITKNDRQKVFRIIYVSKIDPYKHQWNVVEAIHLLRREGFPIILDLIGPRGSASSRLSKSIARFDPDRVWVRYCGEVPYNELPLLYGQADLGLYASSCENLPIILLETMASGLPIACSNRGPMPEVLGKSALYFDPEKPGDILDTVREFILSPKLRSEKAQASFARVKEFTWERCADDTFDFFVKVYKKNQV